MKFRVMFTLVLFFFAGYGGMFADLGDFRKGVDRERNENKSKSGKKGSTASDAADNCISDCMGSCIEEAFKLTLSMWALHNVSVHYARYPYALAKGHNFVHIDYSIFNFTDTAEDKKKEKREKELVFVDGKWVEKKVADEQVTKKKQTVKKRKPVAINKKNYFYTFAAGGQVTENSGNGAFLSLRGRIFRIFGPECEVNRLWDGKEYLDYYAVGINIPIVQFSGIMPDFYIQRSLFRGAVHLTGWSYGFILHSYPLKPFSLMARYGWRHYRYIKFTDMEGRIGVLLNRVEFFAGYRYLRAAYANIRGVTAGLKIWI